MKIHTPVIKGKKVKKNSHRRGENIWQSEGIQVVKLIVRETTRDPLVITSKKPGLDKP